MIVLGEARFWKSTKIISVNENVPSKTWTQEFLISTLQSTNLEVAVFVSLCHFYSCKLSGVMMIESVCIMQMCVYDQRCSIFLCVQSKTVSCDVCQRSTTVFCKFMTQFILTKTYSVLFNDYPSHSTSGTASRKT